MITMISSGGGQKKYVAKAPAAMPQTIRAQPRQFEFPSDQNLVQRPMHTHTLDKGQMTFHFVDYHDGFGLWTDGSLAFDRSDLLGNTVLPAG